MGRKKVFKQTKLNEFVKFLGSESPTTTTKIVTVRNNMPLKRPGTGSANPSAHSDSVLAKRHITRNVSLKERSPLCEYNTICFDGFFIYISESGSASEIIRMILQIQIKL